MDTADGAGTSPDAAPALPERLAARFVLGDVVARGPGHLVVRARDVLLDRPAAVTFHTPGSHTPDRHDPAAVARMQSVVEAVARLDHPHLVPVYDVGTAPDGTVAVVTAWSGGGNLADRIDTGALRTVDTLAAVAAVADALDHVHRRGLVHGAVSPRAVRLDDDDRALLAGAGTASLHGRPDADPADDVRDLAGVLRAGLGSTPVPAEAAGLVDAAEGDPAGRPTAAELVVGLRRAAVAVERAEPATAPPSAAAPSVAAAPSRGGAVGGAAATAGGAPRRHVLASRGALAVAGAALSVLLAGTVVVASGWPVAPAAESDGAATPAVTLPVEGPAIAPDTSAVPADPAPRDAFPRDTSPRDTSPRGTDLGPDPARAGDTASAASPPAADRGPQGGLPAAGPMPGAAPAGPPRASGPVRPDAPAPARPTTPTGPGTPATPPAPVTPAPTTPAPATPAPATPGPTTPGPTTPAPATPGPTTPGPTTTAPDPSPAPTAAPDAPTGTDSTEDGDLAAAVAAPLVRSVRDAVPRLLPDR